jgi:hypothetical protein
MVAADGGEGFAQRARGERDVADSGVARLVLGADLQAELPILGKRCFGATLPGGAC